MKKIFKTSNNTVKVVKVRVTTKISKKTEIPVDTKIIHKKIKIINKLEKYSASY